MKALSLWQPWASLVAMNRKRLETRSWPTTYTGPLAIHASKNKVALDALFGPDTIEELRALKKLLATHGLLASREQYPLGVVVATVDLVGCYRVDCLGGLLHETERIIGNFAPGWFAWHLKTPKPFDPPIAASGCQGLWNWTPPGEMLSGGAHQDGGLFDEA